MKVIKEHDVHVASSAFRGSVKLSDALIERIGHLWHGGDRRW
jgi:hypothetical protein